MLFHYDRIYEHIYGNCERKDLDFQTVVRRSFGQRRLSELLLLVQNDELTVANGKQVMFKIIDGDKRMPAEIAEELGIKGGNVTGNEIKDVVDKVTEENQAIIIKVIETGKDGPVMSLVGKVMKAVNRKGDPIEIRIMIEEAIEKRKNDSGK